MQIAIVTTGDEIMSGNVADTNSAWIADQCWMLGHKVVWHGGVGDNKKDIGDALKLASERADVVLVSGGLGATVDDITIESAAEAFGKKLVFHDEVWQEIQGFFRRVGRECSLNNKRQAYIPDGGKALPNKVGTAPGVQVKLGKAIFFFLPGVPAELYQIFNDSILTWLEGRSQGYAQRFLHCFGLPEASLDQRLKGIDLGDVVLSFRVTFPEIKIKLVVRGSGLGVREGEKMLAEAETKIRERIGEYIYGVDNETLEEVVGNLLKNKGYKLAIAESCTGGLISNMVTNVSGSSGWFERGVVTYSNQSKVDILGVREDTLKARGAVSAETAGEMAEGVRKISGAEIGLAVTGIAGPTGGTPTKPVGTVFIALATPTDTKVHELHFQRDRRSFKLLAAYQALDIVRRYLKWR